MSWDHTNLIICKKKVHYSSSFFFSSLLKLIKLTYTKLISKGNQCACLRSLAYMEHRYIDDCNVPCSGSSKDPCGASSLYVTVYEHEGIYL